MKKNNKNNKLALVNIDGLRNFKIKNRDNLDQSLISLRFMKQIDLFMKYNEINQKMLSDHLDSSQSFISQLLSGTKKINMIFLNKFEKKYNMEFKISLVTKDESNYQMIQVSQSHIKISFSKLETTDYIFTEDFSSVNNERKFIPSSEGYIIK